MWFNKVGARLLSKATTTKLYRELKLNGESMRFPIDMWQGAKVPQGAVSAKVVEVETQFGKKSQKIVTYFDKDGKILERHRIDTTNGTNNLTSISKYDKRELSGFNNKTESFLFNRNTVTYKDGRVVSDNDLNIVADNLKKNPIVTKTNVTLKKAGGNIWYESPNRDITLPAYAIKTDRFESSISQFGKTVPTKHIESTVDYSPVNGYFYLSKARNAVGLTKQEVDAISKDQYLPIRLHTRLNKCEYVKRDVFENTHIPQDTPVEYHITNTLGGVQGNATRGRIRMFNLPDTRFTTLRHYHEVLSHESKHRNQFKIIDDYKAGKIKDPKERQYAKELMEAENNYVSADKDYSSYRKNKLEVEAFDYGSKYEQAFYPTKTNLPQIFNGSNKSEWLFY